MTRQKFLFIYFTFFLLRADFSHFFLSFSVRFRAQVLLLIAFERTVDNLFAVVESLSSHFVSFLWKFARKSTEATAVAAAVAEAVATLVNVIVFNALRSAIPGLIAMRISRHSGQTGTLILIASHRCNSHTVSHSVSVYDSVSVSNSVLVSHCFICGKVYPI